MINIRNNKTILFIFFIVFLILEIMIFFRAEIYIDILYISNFLHLYLTIPIMLWGYSLYYRITDRKIRKLAMLFDFLLIFWMLVKFFKNHTFDYYLTEILWYMYYIPMIFNIYIFYIIVKYSYNLKPRKYTDKYIFIITTLLIILVLTNRYHQMVFYYDNILDLNSYSYEVGYNLIIIWLVIITIFIVFHILRIYKNRKKGTLILLFTIFILMYLHNRGYVVKIPRFISGDFSLMYTIAMMYIFEVSIRLNIIPGNYYYNDVFKMPNIDLAIVDNNYNVKYKTENHRYIPLEVYKSIDKFLMSQEISLDDNKDIIYKIDKVDGGFSIKQLDVFIINKLMKEVNNKSLIINRQNKILTIEQNLKNKYTKQRISDDIKNKVDEVLFEKVIVINELTDLIYGNKETVSQDYLLLAYIKIYVGYCKNKASLVLKGMKNTSISSDDFSIIMHNTIQDSYTSGIQGQFFVDISDDTNLGIVHIFYDLTNELLEKCIRFNKSDFYLRITEDESFYFYNAIIDKYDLNGNQIFVIDNKNINIEFEDSVVLINFSVIKNGNLYE